jgi:hypothetical protein
MSLNFFSVRPFKDLINALWSIYGTTPNLDEHREYVDGCPAVANKYTITHTYGRIAKNTTR